MLFLLMRLQGLGTIHWKRDRERRNRNQIPLTALKTFRLLELLVFSEYTRTTRKKAAIEVLESWFILRTA